VAQEEMKLFWVGKPGYLRYKTLFNSSVAGTEKCLLMSTQVDVCALSPLGWPVVFCITRLVNIGFGLRPSLAWENHLDIICTIALEDSFLEQNIQSVRFLDSMYFFI
jgi:hypothetical protein